MSTAHHWLIRPYAHRGLHDAAQGIVENTASAVRAAIEHDYGIEVDLRLAGCGTVMVFHDRELSRLTTAQGELGAGALAELQAIAFRQGGDRMLTLEALLALVAGRVPLLLEIKSERASDARLVEAVIEAMHGYAGHFAVMSFDPDIIALFRRVAPHFVRGIVAEGLQLAELRQPRQFPHRLRRHLLASTWKARPDFVAYDIDGLPALAPRLVRRWLGKPLLTWTVRTQAQRERADKYADAMIFEGFCP
jgi:glycerophosphoryl diester phosphodiesterase